MGTRGSGSQGDAFICICTCTLSYCVCLGFISALNLLKKGIYWERWWWGIGAGEGADECHFGSQMPLFVTCELLASFMPRNIPCSADPIIIILIIYSSIYVCSLVTLVDLPNHLCKFLLQAYERTVQTTDPSTNYYGVASCKVMRTHSPNVFMGLLKAKISPCLFSYSLA